MTNCLLEHCLKKKVVKGMTLSNQFPKSLFYILSGVIRLTMDIEGRQRPLIIGDYGPGEVACAEGFFDNEEQQTVSVIEDGYVAIISYNKLKALLNASDHEADILKMLAMALTKQYQRAKKRWIGLNSINQNKSAYHIVKDYVVNDIPGEPHPDGVQKKIKCADIADSLGLTRESVGKKLAELHKNKVIRRNGQEHNIVVLA